MRSKGKILVIRGGAIGDFILTLPVLAALRRQFPDAHLEVLGYPHIASLALHGGLADAVRPVEARALAGFFADMGDLDDTTGRYFSGFHIILSYLYDPDGFFAENVKACSKAQFIQGPHRPDETKPVHTTDVLLKPLERLAIFDADPVPRLSFTAPALTAPVLAVHPGSGSEKKNWPAAHWAKFLAHIMSGTDWHVLLIGGEAEGSRLAELMAPLPSSRVRVLQSQPLPELAQSLRTCLGFVGHDSGITHLAAAVGLPGLALWAGTNEAVWHPRSPAFRVLRNSDGIAHLSPETVFTVLRNLLSTRLQ
ncbi:MAG: glycosyltransferase family 9 protein [Limisphaerales bacterium]